MFKKFTCLNDWARVQTARRRYFAPAAHAGAAEAALDYNHP